MDNRDITERSILESERDELRFRVMQLEQTIQDAAHLFTILKYIPESVLVDVAHVLEYGSKTHDPDAWKTADNVQHATDHLGEYTMFGKRVDEDTGKSPLIHCAIRCLWQSALEKEHD